jgi:SPP1 family predicted phage head-tail adaptor
MPNNCGGLDIGSLRHRIEILAPTLAQDTAGGTQELEDSTVFATTRAAVHALSGRELLAAQQVVSQVTHKITMRWMPGIHARQNIRLADGTYLQIQAIIPDDTRRYSLELLCVERNEGVNPA